GRNATTAQVIKILLCPSDPLPENVVEITGASPLPPPWSWGFYGMSSYGGSAGKRSLPSGVPPAFPHISRDGIYWVSTVGRDEETVRKYIREQEGWDRQQGELFE